MNNTENGGSQKAKSTSGIAEKEDIHYHILGQAPLVKSVKPENGIAMVLFPDPKKKGLMCYFRDDSKLGKIVTSFQANVPKGMSASDAAFLALFSKSPLYCDDLVHLVSMPYKDCHCADCQNIQLDIFAPEKIFVPKVGGLEFAPFDVLLHREEHKGYKIPCLLKASIGAVIGTQFEKLIMQN